MLMAGSFYLYSSLFIFITYFNLFSRIKENFGNFKCPEEALVEDAKHYFTRDSPISVAKSLITSTPINFDDESQEYMSPVVSAKSSYKISVKNTILLKEKNNFDSVLLIVGIFL